MKIGNEYVSIKIGKKELKKHNFFFDNYLKLFSKGQIEKSSQNYYNRVFDRVHIKLDTPIENVNTSSILKESEFDLTLYDGGFPTFSATKSTISVTYSFDDILLENREEIDNHQIMAIAFGNQTQIFTYLDTSEYNLIIEPGEELNFSRKDLFTTDAICTGYDYPVHISPSASVNKIIDKFSYVYLYSVGFGENIGYMQEEHIIGDDIEIKEYDDFSFGFILSKSVDEGIYPGEYMFPSAEVYPLTFTNRISTYPRENFYCYSDVYPTVGDYKYIIYKYKIVNSSQEEVGEYMMSYYVAKNGILDIKTKIERM